MKRFKELREATVKYTPVVSPDQKKVLNAPSNSNELDDAEENNRNPNDDASDMEEKAFKPVYKKLKDGTYTLNNESVQINENVLRSLKKIVSLAQPGKVTFQDGNTITVEFADANDILKTHGQLNKVNQNKMSLELAKDAASFNKMKSFAKTQSKITSRVKVLAGLS
jgi:hypothetical protein